MKAKAAVLTGENKPFELLEYEIVSPKSGEALVKMEATGVCGTDAHICTGRLPLGTYPIIIGHEFAGKIAEISAADSKKSGLASGDTVLVGVAVPCGKCKLCRAGDSANCLDLKCTYFHPPEKSPHLYGGYAEYCHSPVSNLIRIPEGLPVTTALIFACAGPTIIHAFRAPSAKAVSSIKTAVVQGLGPVGLFACLYLKCLGVTTVIAVTTGKNQKRNELATALGVDEFITIKETDPSSRVERIKKLSGGAGADCVVECSGNPQAFPEGLMMLRNRGIYLVPGQYSNSGPVMIEPQMITFKALQIFGSAQYDSGDQKEYISFLMNNREMWPAIDAVCTHTWPLEKINEAMDAVIKGNAVKTIITANGEGSSK